MTVRYWPESKAAIARRAARFGAKAKVTVTGRA
ncbi:MAG: hypothetical protein QOD30_983 [Actinomycetota bacterium]|jgi:hypothetical protein|nr:hypothetical protein [Actinomycetota bacterium]